MDGNNKTMNQEGNKFEVRKILPNATTTLILGIFSILVTGPGLVMGIIAIVLHNRNKIVYEGNKEAYNHSYTASKAGFICGIIGSSISASLLVLALYLLIWNAWNLSGIVTSPTSP